jgi:hypothetical protein
MVVVMRHRGAPVVAPAPAPATQPASTPTAPAATPPEEEEVRVRIQPTE